MIALSNGETAVYDAWGRLVEVDNASGIVEQFRYDGTGRRVQVLSNFSGGTPAAAENDYYSGQQVVETDSLTGGTYANGVYVGGTMTGGYQYVWSPRYIDAPIFRDTLDAGGNIVAAARIFYLTDANYNVTAVVDYNTTTEAWQVAERYSYDPYGKATVIYANGDAIDNTILYAGYTYDAATGLYFDRARYYDPQLGRFISQDPLGPAGSGDNLYAYCGDNPVGNIDPTGTTGIIPLPGGGYYEWGSIAPPSRWLTTKYYVGYKLWNVEVTFQTYDPWRGWWPEPPFVPGPVGPGHWTPGGPAGPVGARSFSAQDRAVCRPRTA